MKILLTQTSMTPKSNINTLEKRMLMQSSPADRCLDAQLRNTIFSLMQNCDLS